MAKLSVNLQGLTEVLQNIQQQQADAATAATVPVPHTTINLNPFASNTPFDIGSRAGTHALKKASAALDTTWNGTTKNFCALLHSLRVRALEVNWGSASPHNILLHDVDSTARIFLMEHHHMTEVIVEASCAARTNY